MDYKSVWIVEMIESEKLEYGFSFENRIHKNWRPAVDRFFTRRKEAKAYIAENYFPPGNMEYRPSKYMGPIASGLIKEI